MPSLPERVSRPGWRTAVSLILVLAVPAFGYLAQLRPSAEQVRWILAQLIATGLAWWLPYRAQQQAQASEVEVRTATRVGLGDTLDPIVVQLAALATMTTAGERRPQQQKIQTLVLANAAQLIGPERARACFFTLVEDDGPTRLDPVEASGRSGQPKAKFVQGTPDGDAALKMLEEDRFLFVRDVTLSPPPGWRAEERGSYKTFIAVPVSAADVPLGMLTLDALDAGDLDRNDVQMLRLMAGMLATALARS